MTSKAYVFIDGLETTPIIAGVVQMKGSVGQFRYGKSYQARPDAFSLDPVHLPLNDDIHTTKLNGGLFGALSDAGPDSWGEKVMRSLHSTVPQNKLEVLLAGANQGVGSIMFSLSQSRCKRKRSKNSIRDLSLLFRAKDAILSDHAIPKELKKVFEYGASMGGARPKSAIEDNGKAYLVKFNRQDDLYNAVNVEHASLRMLNELSACRVAKTESLNTPNGDALLVERFDRQDGRPSCHYLSANSVFSLKKVSSSALSNTYSYGALAEFIMTYGAEPADAHDLYHRMVFNVLMGNTDDHSRNHAMLYDFANRHWRLSPAYDVLPINSSKQHGIGLGEQGRVGNVENMLSQSMRFGLKRFKAQKIIDNVIELAQEWRHYFAHHGVGEGDIARLEGIIPSQSSERSPSQDAAPDNGNNEDFTFNIR